MNCQNFRERICEYLDGDPDSDRAGAFTSHLGACSQCRSEVEELKATLAWLKRAKEVVPPPDLRNRVLARLEKEKTPAARRFALRLPKAVAAAAVFVILVTGNLAMVRPPAGGAGIQLFSGERPMKSSPMADAPPAEERMKLAAAPDINEETIDTDAGDNLAVATAEHDYGSPAGYEREPRRLNALWFFLYNLLLIPVFVLLAIQAARERRLT